MDPIPVIRDYCPDDYSSLIELWKITGMGGKERGDDQEVIEQTIRAGGKLLVVVSPEGKLIGSSWMTHDSRRMYIHHFAVHPSRQGHGLSRRLMDCSMDYCRLAGFQVKLEVHKSNQKALNLYKSYGFKSLEGYEVLIMRDVSIKKP